MAGGGREMRHLSSRGRSAIPLLMMASGAGLIVFSIFCIFELQITNNNGIQKGEATIALPYLEEEISSTEFILGGRDSQPKVQVLSWEPRAFLYHNMLTDEECDHLIKVAKPYMKKSTVINPESGRSIYNGGRTSSGTFLKREQDPIIKEIERKIADFTFVPVDHGEGLQILHYGVGQKYDAHYDFFPDSISTENGGQRVATVLMYLSDVEAGGETVFPAAQGCNETHVQFECAEGRLKVKPKKGMALLFWSLGLDAQKDRSSRHGGCPVIEGDKWSATKWLHVKKYGPPM